MEYLFACPSRIGKSQFFRRYNSAEHLCREVVQFSQDAFQIGTEYPEHDAIGAGIGSARCDRDDSVIADPVGLEAEVFGVLGDLCRIRRA